MRRALARARRGSRARSWSGIPDLGGIWDIRFPGSPMYESAHFISSRTLSGFRDFPMPESYPDYPSHRQVLAYLRDYAERHAAAAPAALRRGGACGAARGGGLAAGAGRRRDPALRRPGPGDGPAVAAEAARASRAGSRARRITRPRYHSARQLDGKRVLVVGGGNSGCDIAADAGSAGVAGLPEPEARLLVHPQARVRHARGRVRLEGAPPSALDRAAPAPGAAAPAGRRRDGGSGCRRPITACSRRTRC